MCEGLEAGGSGGCGLAYNSHRQIPNLEHKSTGSANHHE